jgi:hypothetical protein
VERTNEHWSRTETETGSPEAAEVRDPPIQRERAGLLLARTEVDWLIAEELGVQGH